MRLKLKKNHLYARFINKKLEYIKVLEKWHNEYLLVGTMDKQETFYRICNNEFLLENDLTGSKELMPIIFEADSMLVLLPTRGVLNAKDRKVIQNLYDNMEQTYKSYIRLLEVYINGPLWKKIKYFLPTMKHIIKYRISSKKVKKQLKVVV